MSNYDKAIRTVTEVKTIASHMVALGKIRAASEDGQLNSLIASLIWALQFQHQQSQSKSTPTSLTLNQIQETFNLINYCNYQNMSRKPEWQILAERNGWSPPRGPI